MPSRALQSWRNVAASFLLRLSGSLVFDMEISEVLAETVFTVFVSAAYAGSSCSITLKREHVRTGFEFVEIVCPLLHHSPPLRKVRGAVIGAPIRVFYGMG